MVKVKKNRFIWVADSFNICTCIPLTWFRLCFQTFNANQSQDIQSTYHFNGNLSCKVSGLKKNLHLFSFHSSFDMPINPRESELTDSKHAL